MKALKAVQNSLWSPLLILVSVILELGLPQNKIIELSFETLTSVYLGIFLFRTIQAFQKKKNILRRSIFITIGAMTISLIISTILRLFTDYIFVPHGLYYLLLIVFTIIDISTKFIVQGNNSIHPTLAFVISFVGVIWVGALLLMLPNATTKGITLIDALFTSTSATCVTGLAVLDTGKDFTLFGQIVILMLIQVGGLGILTFTNLFGLVFKGSSFRNRIWMHELVGGDGLMDSYSTAVKIILFTFTVEFIGALFIYVTMDKGDFFFAIFHAISAFCNAGFSTMSNSLYEMDVRFNYPMHMIIAFLIIIGGVGYGVFYSYYARVKYRILCFLQEHLWLFQGSKLSPPSASRDINAYLVTRATLILLVVGWVAFFVLEYNNTMAEHTTFGGKLAVSFFGSVTPRTAGFNSVDMTQMVLPTVLLYVLLMWIGGSPGSTAGGIKTTTFAIATLNIINQIRGKERLVLHWKEIASSTINRVGSIISLSLIAVGFGTFLLSVSDPDLNLRDTAFECFSAYATVGLSLGITAKLSIFGKIVIIMLMFLGRVSFLSFLIGLLSLWKKPPSKELEYPKGNVFIN